MRIAFVILAALVFGAMLLFDTTALVQLSWFCLNGGCGPTGQAITIVTLAVIVLVLVSPLLRRWIPWRRGRPASARGSAKAPGGKSAGRKPATSRRKSARTR